MPGRRVLVPFDRSPEAQRGLDLALHLARIDRRKSALLPVYVVEVERAFPLDADLPRVSAHGETCLAHAEAAAKHARVRCEPLLLQARSAGPAVVQTAHEQHADLIVLGVSHADSIHSSGPQTALDRRAGTAIDLGPTADYVLSHAPCEVIVVREAPHERPQARA